MADSIRPATLVPGWQGAWGLNVRRALVALRDEGPLSLAELARVMRWKALHADLTSGHTLGPDHGATMLAKAILEDAAAVVAVDDEDRYSVPADMTTFHSPYIGADLRLLTVEEQAAAKVRADAERPLRRWMSRDVYSPFGGKAKDKWVDGRLPGRRHTDDEVADKAREIETLGWLPSARIVKDQRGVTIDGHLHHDALERLGIDPDTGVDERSGEPYVEIRAFNNDAARLHYALTANWSTLKAPTKNAISHQVLGDVPLTLEAVADLIRPAADLMAAGRMRDAADAAEPEPPATVERVSRAPKTLNEDDLNLIAQVERRGFVGATYKEVDPDGHGPVTGRLSRLADGGHLVVLAEKRDRCGIYVVPEWVCGRPEGTRRKSTRPAAAPVPVLPPADPAVFSNARVAAMTWREAAGSKWINQHGKGRFWTGGLAPADASVADNVEALIAAINAELPWLLPMICERLAQP